MHYTPNPQVYNNCIQKCLVLVYIDFHGNGGSLVETKIFTMANIGQHFIAIISLCEWDGATPTHNSVDLRSTYSTQNNQLTCSMAKENHMGMLQYHPKTGNILTFQPICRFSSWADPKCYY